MLKKTLGQLLIDAKELTQEQVDEAYKALSVKKGSFVDYILEKNLVSEITIATLFSTELGLPLLTQIDDQMADPELLLKVPLKFLREQYVLPIRKDSKIYVVTANPLDFQPIDELAILFEQELLLAVAPRKVIVDALSHFYPLESSDGMIEDLEDEGDMSTLSFGEIDEKDIMSAANEAPIIKLVNYILLQAVKMEASDIHISPQEKEVRVRYRVDGIMHTAMTPPKRVQAALASRLKIMAHLNIAEKRKTQDGRIEIKVSDKAYDIRVSVLPSKFGENIVMRILDKEKGFVALEQMAFSEPDLKVILNMITKPNGILLVTGPTGSGKTTTLYSILHKINLPTVNIITVEDPIEYQMSGITQVPVDVKAGMTFAVALRSILRQDPDIVMIGETRDQETAQIAIQAALTGHFVLSTLHTNSAPASITRLLDMGVEPFLIASSIVGVIAQRLVRKLCPVCKESYTPSADLLETIGMKDRKDSLTFYKARGCKECNDLGYKGRMPLYEIMRMTDDVSRLTMAQASTNDIREQAIKDGMIILLHDGIQKIQNGLTSIEEVLSVATVYDAHKQNVQQ